MSAYRESMISNGLKFRWLNVQTFEIILPNGKVILFDPQFKDPRPEDAKAIYYKIPEEYHITRESVERVDYLIINHTHCDHIIDLEYFAQKFDPVIICPSNVAYDLCKCHDIKFTSTFPVNEGETYVFEDFTLKTYHGQHNNQPSTYNHSPMMYKKSYDEDRFWLNEIANMGGVYSMNYMITTNENLNIGFFSGRVDHFSAPTVNAFAQAKPNVLIRQFSANKENYLGHIEKELLKIRPQMFIPMHHEKFDCIEQERLQEMFDELNERMIKNHLCTRCFIPTRAKWYQIALSMMPVEE